MDESSVSPEPVVVKQPRSGFRWYVVAGGVVFGLMILGGGMWLGRMMNTPTEPVAVVSPIPTSIPTDPTANWKTHTVSGIGFTFKYPPNYVVDEGSHTIQVASQNDKNYPGGNLTTFYIKEDTTLVQHIAQLREQLKTLNLDSTIKQSPFTLNGMSFTKLSYASAMTADNVNYIIVNGKNLIIFSGDLNILSTFKFTDNTISMANWKTFSDISSFTLKYPAEWEAPTKYLQSTHVEYIIPAEMDVRVGFTYDQSLGRSKTYEEEVALEQKNAGSQKLVTVDGVETQMYISKVLNGGVKSADVLLKDKSGIIVISFSIYGQESEKTIDQILSTFKFTN